jgi:hypothetical protein
VNLTRSEVRSLGAKSARKAPEAKRDTKLNFVRSLSKCKMRFTACSPTVSVVFSAVNP